MLKHLLPSIAAAALVASSPAFAHAKLLSTMPAAGAVLAAAPAALTLTFNEDVQLASLKLASLDTEVPIVFDRGMNPKPAVTVALPALTPGKYQVRWSALTHTDGHVVKGTFSFVVSASP